MIWTPAWCEFDGTPHFFLTPQRRRYRFDCIGFENDPQGIQMIQNRFLRTQVATCWYLPLSGYSSFEDYLTALSAGSRKKLRKLERAYSNERIHFVRMTSNDDLEDLLRLIHRLIEEQSLCYIMGPGDYDRKKTFRASPLPIYRYETFTWKNANGLLKLYVRGWQERKKLRRIHGNALHH